MGKKTISPDDRISTVEAAAILGLSERQTRQHAVNGSLPGERIGHGWIFRRGDVQAKRGKLPRPGKRAKVK